ncbi:hypothetical protein [Streptomyces typhae]|nr:hypothetical protein [Streptomyces typhae]
MSEDKALRLALAEKIAANSSWRDAVERVPRHEFLHGGFFERVNGP